MVKLSAYGKEIYFEDKLKNYGLVMPGDEGLEIGKITDITAMLQHLCSKPKQETLDYVTKILSHQKNAEEFLLGKIPDIEWLPIYNTVELLESVKEACEAAD